MTNLDKRPASPSTRRSLLAGLLLAATSGCGHPDAGSLDLSERRPSTEELLGPGEASAKGARKRGRYTPPLNVAP